MQRDVAGAETRPEIGDLKAFCLVVDLGSVTAAAKALGETKGSVSRRLTRLERTLGVVLLRRSPRRVQATEDGVAYRGRVGRALELLDDANAQARQARATPHGHLRVTAPVDVGMALAAPVVARFVEKYPEVTVDVVLTEQRLDFDAHQIDVALRATEALEDSSLVAHRLLDLEAALFASPAYLRKHGEPRTPEELCDHRILLATASRGRAPLTLRPRGEGKGDARSVTTRVRAAVTASDFSFGKETALASGGIALLPSAIAERELRQKRLVPVLDGWIAFTASLYLVHPGGRFIPPKVRAFRDHVLDAFGVKGRRG